MEQIYAEWEKKNTHLKLATFCGCGFPLRDMEQSKSTIYVNDKESPHFINHPLARWISLQSRIYIKGL